jgi:hypothetical protein
MYSVYLYRIYVIFIIHLINLGYIKNRQRKLLHLEEILKTAEF